MKYYKEKGSCYVTPETEQDIEFINDNYQEDHLGQGFIENNNQSWIVIPE